MACEECTRLLGLYRRALEASKNALEQYKGAAGADIELAGRMATQLRIRSVEASDKFLEHVRKDHPTLSARS